MKKALVVLALLTAAVASPAFAAQHRVQHEEGIYANVPAGTNAIQYHEDLAAEQAN